MTNPWEGSTVVRIYHESFREFLIRDSVYQVFPGEAEERLVEHLVATSADRDVATINVYALRHLVEHLQSLRRYDDTIQLSLNDKFLTAQDALTPRHELSLATRDAGLRAALKTQDIERFTAIALACGSTRDCIAKITPMYVYASEGLAAALSIADGMGPENRTMWYLALAVGPHTGTTVRLCYIASTLKMP